MTNRHFRFILAMTVLMTGCQTSRSWVGKRHDSRMPIVHQKANSSEQPHATNHLSDAENTNHDATQEQSGIAMVSALSVSRVQVETTEKRTSEPGAIDFADDGTPAESSLKLGDVVQSIYASYPLLQIAFYGRNIAAGEQLSAEGAWDLKLKVDANNAPLGFYQTYRNGAGFEQPTMWGGEVFGGYKLGRGNFEPWYGNRETNDGGEFGAGIRIPLAQNRAIDERRANLWKATYGVSAVEPVIQAQIIEFIRAGTHSYWAWVAAGLNLKISRQLLDLAEQRDNQIEGQVKAGARPEALLIDNHRLILSREVKLIDAQRKLQSTAIKLSLFYRTTNGQPIIPTEDQLPRAFPRPTPVSADKIPQEIVEALGRRPELTELDFQHRMTQVDLQQAENQTLPELDATLWSAKDVGGWTDSKGSKSPYQAEAGLNFSVPLQRRKAMGKIAAVEAKLVQIATKRQFAENKISTEVNNAVITIEAAYRSMDKAQQSLKLAEKMEQLEVLKLEKGDSDLLLLNLREVATFDARVTEIETLLHYYESQADYRAALALDVADFGLLGDPNQSLPATRPEP